MIRFLTIGVENRIAQFELDKAFKVLNKAEEGKAILVAHQEELFALVNELLDVLREGANEYEEEAEEIEEDDDEYIEDDDDTSQEFYEGFNYLSDEDMEDR